MLLGASHSAIENLGLIYLLGLARDEGCDRGIALVKNHNFEPFFERAREMRPDIIGFNIYTGNHLQLFEAFERLRKELPRTRLVIGGPHATYFPEETIQHADNVVMSEGFNAFRKILRNEVGRGIMPFEEGAMEPFPHPDRSTFYRDSPEHATSPIKSIIGMTGCPYSCSYCYNSTPADRIKVPESLCVVSPEGVSLNQVSHCSGHEHTRRKGARLFPRNIREVEAVIKEGKEIAELWPQTKTLYFQDDVFGFDVTPGGYLETLASRWKSEVGIPFHAQMRWEMTANESGDRRLDLTKEAGASGLTLAIEAADPTIRKEVLDRNMPQQMMFDGMKKVIERGLTVRTEQITGLPYGATSKPTSMNLEADLELLALNVRLRAETGGPTMAWASTLAPYKKTNIGEYCEQFGHYIGANNDVPDTFFDSSVLRFPAVWIGPQLEKLKGDPAVWLSPSELQTYRIQNAELRRHFNTFALIPEGHKAAADYLRDPSKFGYAQLGNVIATHLAQQARAGNPEAQNMLQTMNTIATSDFGLNGSLQDARFKQELRALAPYLAVLPQPEQTAQRAIHYALNTSKGEMVSIEPRTLSTAVRHQLYDGSLYRVDVSRNEERERYPVKV